MTTTAINTHKICDRCKLKKKYADFYKPSTLDEYPDGYLDVCKQCLASTYVARDASTFIHILRALDIPWMPTEYQKIYNRNFRPSSPNNIAYLGKYVAAMKLAQNKTYRFLDSNERQKLTGSEEMYDPIENYNYDHPLAEPILAGALRKDPNRRSIIREVDAEEGGHTHEIASPLRDGTLSDAFANSELNASGSLEFTKEEMYYLRGKWGMGFTPEELGICERKYHEMMNSFDIQTAIEEDFVMKICVVSMRFDKSLEMQDPDGVKNYSGIYDKLTKSAGLQPSQNDKSDGDYMNAASYLVLLAEREGPIERYDVTENPDIVDRTIRDLKHFTQTLVNNDESILDRHEIEKADAALKEQDALVKNQEVYEDDDDEVEIRIVPVGIDDYGVR